MSENIASDLAVFFRYTVPGFFLAVSLALALPIRSYAAIPRQIADPTILAAAAAVTLFLFVLATGWVLYHLVFPIWVKLLSSRLFGDVLYPKSGVHSMIGQSLGKNAPDIDARALWSYLMWSKVDKDLRSRIKLLADYSHSLYLFAFISTIFLPTIDVIFRIVTKDANLISTVASEIGHFMNVPSFTAEAGIILASIVLGVVSLSEGKDRLRLCDSLQVLAYRSFQSEIEWKELRPSKS
jgi:hypothetical protein